jgi:hypothetical protein
LGKIINLSDYEEAKKEKQINELVDIFQDFFEEQLEIKRQKDDEKDE